MSGAMMPSALSDLCALRERIARLEGVDVTHQQKTHDGTLVPLGAESLPLDNILGGGLKRGTLHEIVAETPRDEAAASGFAVALAALCARNAMLVWIVEDRAAWETGTPYRPGLAAHGLHPDKLVLVKTKDTHTTLWAAEEALRAGAPVVLTELWRAKSYDLAASRRLLLAARRRGATSLLVHVGLRGDELSSGADTRFAVAALPSARRPSASHGLPMPGPAGFGVRLTKLRGSGTQGSLHDFDRDQVHGLFWDPAGGSFRQGVRPAHWRDDYARGDAA